MERRPWTEVEIVSALALYYQIPFGAIDEKNPAIIELARTLGRTSGSIALKLANLASLDPTVIGSGRHGMANASQLDRKVFAESSGSWLQLTWFRPYEGRTIELPERLPPRPAALLFHREQVFAG